MTSLTSNARRCAVSILFMLGAGCAAHTRTSGFDRALREYLELREQATRRVGALTVTDDATELEWAQDRLAGTIQGLRAGLPEGVFFGRDVSSTTRDRLSRRLSKADGAAILAGARDVSPPASFRPAVNARYPAVGARASMPGALLEVLPRIPALLSYRLVGDDLLLLDRNTGVILDVLRDATPLD